MGGTILYTLPRTSLRDIIADIDDGLASVQMWLNEGQVYGGGIDCAALNGASMETLDLDAWRRCSDGASIILTSAGGFSHVGAWNWNLDCTRNLE
jgi:hypothetical protein